MRLPRSLPFEGRTILSAGRGRAPGAHAYMDLATGEPLELFVGTVVRTGPRFLLVQVRDNPALPTVRVDHHLLGSPARVKDTLIVGPLVHRPEGPAARVAWATDPPRRDADAERRVQGVVGYVAPTGTFGRIIDSQGNLVFVHCSEFRDCPLRVGQPVSFVVVDEGRGPKAVGVRAGR